MHSHENATIVLVLGGDYRETCQGGETAHPPMTVIAKPAGQRHANNIGRKGAHCLVIELTAAKISELGPVCRPCEFPQARRGGAASSSALRIVHELRRSDPLTPLALESAVLQLAVDLSRYTLSNYSHEPRWRNEVIDLIHSEPPRALRLSRLAATIGVHPIHLARTFRRHYGSSIGCYVRLLRIHRAIAMLTKTSMPLSDISLASGFYDQSHMARAIKRETGKTSAQLRAMGKD
jgi:AraC family transcriptional regulator